MNKIYRVTFDHQWEPQDYGTFSTLEKAMDFVKNSLNDKMEISYNRDGIVIFKSGNRIKEEVVR